MMARDKPYRAVIGGHEYENGAWLAVNRVLAVIPGDPNGASMIFARRQVDALRKRGISCKSFFLSSRTSITEIVREWRRFRRELNVFRPQVIHAHYGTMTAFFCALGSSIPLVVSYRGNDINFTPSVSWLRWASGMVLSQLSALKAKRILCVSPELKRKLWWRRRYAIVVPSGLDTEKFYPRPRDEVRARLGWTKEEKVVVFNVGKDPVNKRFALAKSAVEVARHLCGEFRFVLLDGEVEPSQMPLIMNGADALLLTSASEGSPNVVKEAIACNLPVVSVDVGDVRERLRKVTPSRIVDGDPDELGGALAEILVLGSRSNGSGVVAEFSLGSTTSKIMDVYEELWKHRRQ